MCFSQTTQEAHCFNTLLNHIQTLSHCSLLTWYAITSIGGSPTNTAFRRKSCAICVRNARSKNSLKATIHSFFMLFYELQAVKMFFEQRMCSDPLTYKSHFALCKAVCPEFDLFLGLRIFAKFDFQSTRFTELFPANRDNSARSVRVMIPAAAP